jgi:acyl-homoserine-lactone acylase
MQRALALVALSSLAAGCASRTATAALDAAGGPPEARQVEVIRTGFGVPHIYADNFRALGYAIGYLQLEDYGDRVPLILLGSRGELARHQGRVAVESDFASKPYYQRAIETYALIDRDTRDVYEGFAVGVNRYIAQHPSEFPVWLRPDFTGYDVAAAYIYRPSARAIRDLEVGSSAWALAPSRTTSGHAILLRNPHLNWNAGYWEAHLVVPNRLDFYGDLRIGGPIGIVGGFNPSLGFATTNNDVDTEEIYELQEDPERPDHYRFDGASMPVRRELISVSYLEGTVQSVERRERQLTHLGPVVRREPGRIFVLRAAEDGEYRGGDQFLRMMQARSLEQWKAAMRLRAHFGSNFIYADAAGNIFYLWNAAIPRRPHPAGGERAVPASRTEHVWTSLHDLDELPQLLNPPGGYVRNENDAPWLTNLRQRIDRSRFPAYFEDGPFSLRSQHSTMLLDHDTPVSLEDVVRAKHTDRMLLADRVKDDLLAAIRTYVPVVRLQPDVRDVMALLERWDNTASEDSRGSVLFGEWWRMYTAAIESARGEDANPFAEAWRDDAPLTTPDGLADPALAAATFITAVQDTAARFGAPDVAWGDVHRVRRGDVDVPASGCPGALGCFRVLTYTNADDGRRVASGGDGWVLAVEFSSPPRAYSVLAYGQSNKPESPYHASQAAMFARGEMKPVVFTRADVERHAVRRYRPGAQ